MLTKYCPNPNCAKPNFYTLDVPRICGFCGTNLSGMISNASKSSKVPSHKRFTNGDEKRNDRLKKTQKELIAELRRRRDEDEIDGDGDDGYDDFVMPDTSSLGFEISGTTRQKLTFSDLAKQRKTGFSPRPVEKMSKEEIIRQFKEEAKAHSGSIEITDNDE